MNKAELIAAIAAKTGETKKGAEASLNAFVDGQIILFIDKKYAIRYNNNK